MSPTSERRMTLRDGTTIRLRRLRAEDETKLAPLWWRWSSSRPVQAEELNVRSDIDEPGRRWAVVAVRGLGEREQIVGVARCERVLRDASVAEVDVLVDERQRGRGIGSLLLQRLAVLARQAGVRRLTGEIPGNNPAMLQLLEDLGLAYECSSAGEGRLRIAVSSDETDSFLAAVARDEKEAATAALRRFFEPRSIAVVGASRNPLSVGGLLFGNLLRGGFQGGVYPVNRTSAVVQSVAAYPSLSDCPEVPELVIVSVPAEYVNGVVEEAGRLGVRAVCIISAGFAEASESGVERQRELMRIASGYGVRIVGPNCMGLMNASDAVRMNGTFSAIFPDAGRMSFSSQSGALGVAVIEQAHRLGLGMGTFVSVGNKADISGNDLLLYWEDDPLTDVILMYLESFGNPRKFSRIARRISRRKPIVAVKSGRTAAGARAASSHTGALAAGDVAVDALFRQTGVIRTETLEELFDVATMLSSQPLPRGPRVAILTNGGGLGILAADACESHGLEVPPLSEETRDQLREFLPPEAGISNPVDMTAHGTAERYAKALRVLGRCQEIDALIVIFVPPVITRAEDVARSLVDARRELPPDRPLLSVFLSAKGVPPELAAARVPSFPYPEEAARALGHVARYAEWRRRPTGRVVQPAGLGVSRARSVIDAALEGLSPTLEEQALSHDALGPCRDRHRSDVINPASRWLSAEDAIAVLEAYGVPLARSRIVRSPDEGARAQQQIGVPVAVKAATSLHKVDVGAIRLDLSTADEVANAIEQMRRSLVDAGLAEHAEAWLVQEMVSGGVEMLVGVSHDPSFGPLIMAGMGGTLVELHKDVSVRVTPLTDIDVHEMLRSLRMFPLLSGFRGRPPANIEAIEDLLHRISAMVEDLPEITEMDLNPVLVRERDVFVVDVRVKVSCVQPSRPGLPSAPSARTRP
ncbi:MAG: GNAT family N-acetyltransferase [Acidobacteriota bacterium]|nr:MAG: GNAT family N-acetyltransferase [Acidobacteriota bacterium]